MEPTVAADTANCAFTYTATNFFNGSNVTVYVKHIVDPTQMSMLNLVGTNYAVINPYTGENLVSATSIINGPRWNNTIWVSNNNRTNNWHFMSVVYPVKAGQPAPTITRIDDNHVRVQCGANDDTIGVDPSTSPPTFSISLTGPALGGARPAPPTNLRTVP
jgi:hypothetical protein